MWLRSIVSVHAHMLVGATSHLIRLTCGSFFSRCCCLKIGTDDGRAKDLRILRNWIWASGVNEKPPHYLQILWCLKSKCFLFDYPPAIHTHTHVHFISKSKTSMDLLRCVLNQPGSCGLYTRALRFQGLRLEEYVIPPSQHYRRIEVMMESLGPYMLRRDWLTAVFTASNYASDSFTIMGDSIKRYATSNQTIWWFFYRRTQNFLQE